VIPRSWLYVPGDDAERLAKAVGRGADALIIDLEDGVAPSAKESARAITADFLRGHAGGPAAWVRINSERTVQMVDLAALADVRVAGIVVPKAEDPERLDRIITERPDCAWMPLVESARGIQALTELLTCEHVTHLQIGEADLRADLGVTFGPDESELLHVRQQAVIAATAAGIEPPIAPVSTEFRDLDALRRSTEALARMGYVGRACIHPAQIAVVHDVFTPDAERIEWALAVCAAADDAYARGQGAFIGPDGRMADEAVVRAARRILALRPE